MRAYFTTPIYYVNDTPHIGHAYTTIVTDVMARYRRLFGDEMLFLTGTDEHGQKVQAAAEKRNIAPQAHCDELVVNFKKIWKELQIENDIFIRTTDAAHKKAVQAALQDLWDKKEIYSQDYEGWYSVSEEIFYTEKDLINGKTPQGNDVVKIKEKNYFFKMGKYQERLIKYIQDNPRFIQPEAKKNEVLGFLRQPLHDLCISRPKSRLAWGIELPFDPDYVTYVWFDALLNYTNAVGLNQDSSKPATFFSTGNNDQYAQAKESNKELFQKWWTDAEAVHFIGKDILMTHAVYWPTMLMAMNVALPKTIFAHGWWLTESGEKMSKSKGPVIKPLDVKNLVGVDPLRYFLTRDIQFGNDAAFSVDLVVSRVNADLANNFGNLLSRSVSILEKNSGGKIPARPDPDKLNAPSATAIVAEMRSLPTVVEQSIRDFAPHAALQAIMNLMTSTNKFFSDNAPWSLYKTNPALADEVLYITLDAVRLAAILLIPVMPEKMNAALDRLQIPNEQRSDWKKINAVFQLVSGSALAKGDPLFPRVEYKPEASV